MPDRIILKKMYSIFSTAGYMKVNFAKAQTEE